MKQTQKKANNNSEQTISYRRAVRTKIPRGRRQKKDDYPLTNKTIMQSSQQQPQPEQQRQQQQQYRHPATFVIALENSKRWPATQQRLQQAGFRPQRWPAVDGRKIDPETLRRSLTPRAQMEVIEQRPRGDPNRLTVGATGCAMSHRAVWEWLLRQPASSVPYVVIFEDDANPRNRGLSNGVHNLISELRGPNNFDILFLHYWPSYVYGTELETPQPSQRHVQRSRGVTYSMLGYVITHEGARKLLQKTMPIATHVDVMIGFAARQDPGLRAYVVVGPEKWVTPDFTFNSTVFAGDKDDAYWRGNAERVVASPLRFARTNAHLEEENRALAAQASACGPLEDVQNNNNNNNNMWAVILGALLLVVVIALVVTIVSLVRARQQKKEDQTIDVNDARPKP